MDRAGVLLQQLRTKLGTWMDSIRRATGATSVTFVTRDGGEFSIRVIWKQSDGERAFEKEFTKTRCLGASLQRPQTEWRVEKRACDYAREIMSEVLAQRGAL
jgi:hypothetical protein